MKDSIMPYYNEMSKAKFEVDDANNKLEQAKDAYFNVLIGECIKDILSIQQEEGKLTERDLKIFLSNLVVNVKNHSR